MPGSPYYRLALRGEAVLDRLWSVEARLHGVELGAGVEFIGRPILQRLDGRIVIHAGALIRSREFPNHGHMHRTKLLTTRPGALIEIGERVHLNGVAISAEAGVTIGDDTVIASGVAIADCHGHVLDAERRAAGDRDEPEPVTIGRRVWIGANVIVLKGVTIGDDTVVGAGSVVSRSLPAGTVCAGIPARVIRTYQK